MMQLDEKSVKVDLGMELKEVKGQEIVNGEVGLERGSEGCRNKCKELEERSSMAEERCVLLELLIEKKKSEFELLEGKLGALEVERAGIEDEVKLLKRRNVELEKQITQIENENKADIGKGTGKVVDLTEEKDEEDKVIQLMIENKVLECEKKRAESEVEVWKLKYKKLEWRVSALEKDILDFKGGQSPLAGMMKSRSEMHKKQTSKEGELKDGLDVANSSEHLEAETAIVDNNETIKAATGSPSIDMPSKLTTQIEGSKTGFLSEPEMDHGSQVRKRLAFSEESSLSKKMAPSTPGSARASFGIIDISDSEDELANTNVNMPHFDSQVNRTVPVSTDLSSWNAMGNENKKTSDDNLKRTLADQTDEEDMDGYKGNFLFISTPKRKRASNIVTSDSESDDDNVPICKLKTKHLQELNQDKMDSYSNGCSVTATVSEEKVGETATPRRRLVALRNRDVKNAPEQNSPSNSNDNGANSHSRIHTNEGVENEEMEEDGSESDTEGESLGGFIVSSSDVSGSDDGSSASDDVSYDNVDFGEVLSRIRRNRDSKLKWEFEADMLAAFGKDLELCMKAVCALYRQQTSEERCSRGTIYSNQRGFSQCDAFSHCVIGALLWPSFLLMETHKVI
ncbi:uncharacterized protein LOC114306602 isoform X2 [Camellia sinensis]|uniref:uncharacterized protein LOC114306602 isoform X2 n=1 Tax=Camellia sinensis TaxID=4442 RepID=UPI001036900C|nr:uncharacterized protein LOC114306602 isoform X2 [Camellia sinensis]